MRRSQVRDVRHQMSWQVVCEMVRFSMGPGAWDPTMGERDNQVCEPIVRGAATLAGIERAV